MPENTKFSYMYRDTGNNKATAEVVFSGRLSQDQRRSLINSMIRSENDELGNFIPGLVGLPDLQNQFYDRHIAILDAMIEPILSDPAKRSEKDQKNLEDLQSMADDMAAVKPIWWPDDMTSHEILEISDTEREVTDQRSIHDFAAEMAEVDWDQEYLPPFHGEMLANYREYLENEESEPPAP